MPILEDVSVTRSFTVKEAGKAVENLKNNNVRYRFVLRYDSLPPPLSTRNSDSLLLGWTFQCMYK